jgi:hypothetical protein
VSIDTHAENPPRKRRHSKGPDLRRRKGDRHKAGRKQVRLVDNDRHKRAANGYRADRQPRPFLAIDGEGRGTYENGVQKYQIMVAANDKERYVLDEGRPLTTDEILVWLCSLPKERIFVGFSFGYDVTMMTHGLPHETLMALAQRSKRPLYTWGRFKGQPRLVRYGKYGLDYLPRKMFLLQFNREPQRMIYDVWSFFGTSYIKTLENWKVATEEEFATIKRGKERRPDTEESTFDRALETEYSVLECKTLCRIMEKLRTLCTKLGYPLRSWYGAGSVAKAMLHKHGIVNYLAPVPEKMVDYTSRAFFGGRFETASLGQFENVYYYDIASAYPNIIQNLPCLAHGTWRKVRKYQPDAKVALWHLKWDVDTLSWAPFPWRDDKGMISFPLGGEGCYYASEVAAAIAMFPNGVKVLDGWVYTQTCEHKPFAWVPEVYRLRAEYKSKGEPEEIVLKLGLNSCYGATAQTVGTKKFANAIWAGMITAGTRAMLLGAIAQAPEKVLSTATDSISSLVPLNLWVEKGKPLGSWEHKISKDVFIAGDGISYSESSPERTRTRGISAKDMVWDRMLAAWDKDGMRGAATFSLTRFEGLTIMAARGKVGLAGRWQPQERTLKFESHKRFPITDPDAPHNTMPHRAETEMSAAYSKLTILENINDEETMLALEDKDAYDIYLMEVVA